MTPTHYHINTNQRGTIIKVFGGIVCRFLLEEPMILQTNITQEIKTIVCAIENLKEIEK